LGLVVFELVENDLFQRAVFDADGVCQLGFRRNRVGVGLRIVRGRGSQRSAPGGLLKRKP